MTAEPLLLSSLSNPRVKSVVKLRKRSHRDELDLLLIEGYREIKRALDNNHLPTQLFYCRELFQGRNEDKIMDRCAEAGAEILECAESVFLKMAYRDRPEGLLALAPQIRFCLNDIVLPENPLVLIAEAVEKPGNLGTMLRSADAAGVHAVIVCDPCTDINNPNVVRASIGTLFALPVAAASTKDTLEWLDRKGIGIVAATPHAEPLYVDVDMAGPTAIAVGTEQYGLSEEWMQHAQSCVRIPMLGQSDSLNVAAAATILLYEAVRQRTASQPHP